MALKERDRKVADDIVQFVARHPILDRTDDVMAAISIEFRRASEEEYLEGFARLVRMLRTYVKLDAVESALVEAKAEAVGRNRKRVSDLNVPPAAHLKGKRPARPAPSAQLDLFKQVKGDRHV